MTVDIQPWSLPGCWLLRTPLHRDARGTFRKLFQRSLFAEHGFPVDWGEQFVTLSGRDVIRGLHLQLPPSGQWKLVSCLTGSVLDAAVDLRVDSPTYGGHATQVLTQDMNEALLLPPGVAHGFLATSDACLMAYSVTAEHDGVRDGESAGTPPTSTGRYPVIRWCQPGMRRFPGSRSSCRRSPCRT